MLNDESPEVPGSGVEGAAESPAVGKDDNTTASSPAGTDGVEKTLFERVKDVLQPGSEKSPVSDSGEGKPSPKPEGTEGSDPDVPDEITQLSEKAQDRFRELVAKRKDAEARADAVEREFKPKAEKLDTILTYMERNRIEPTEFDNALEMTRMIKAGDYSKALEALTPIYRELANRAGKILPADLQERVKLGYISEEDARALHETRTQAKNLETRTTEQQQRDQAERQRQEIERTANTAAAAGDQWAKAKATSDPDWHLKQDLVAEQVKLDLLDRQSRGEPDWFPKTAEEVAKRAEAALKVVEGRLKKFAPKPIEKKVATGQPASPRSAARPSSSKEAIRQALGG